MSKPRPSIADVIGALKEGETPQHRGELVASPGPTEVFGEHKTSKNQNAPPELVDLAQEAAHAQDAADEAYAKAKVLKLELEEAMLGAGVQQIFLSDRSDPVAFHETTPGKRVTLKYLKEALGAPKANDLWSGVPVGKPTLSLKIPKPGVDEPSADY